MFTRFRHVSQFHFSSSRTSIFPPPSPTRSNFHKLFHSMSARSLFYSLGSISLLEKINRCEHLLDLRRNSPIHQQIVAVFVEGEIETKPMILDAFTQVKFHLRLVDNHRNYICGHNVNHTLRQLTNAQRSFPHCDADTALRFSEAQRSNHRQRCFEGSATGDEEFADPLDSHRKL